MDAIVLRRAAVPLLAATAFFLPAAAGAAAPSAKCVAKADKAGDWEVVLGTFHARTAAKSLVTRAAAKKLPAVVESNGCGSYEVAVQGLKTQNVATAKMKTARADGFHASVERS